MSNVVPTSYDADVDWKITVKQIEEETNNYNIDTMCSLCINKQIKDHGKITIACKGLHTLKESLKREDPTYTDEDYEELVRIVGKDGVRKAEETENSYTWMENNVVDPELFNPRKHQRMINNCSAQFKVLRMGRRCVSQNMKIEGIGKKYKVKHLAHLFKKHKKLPPILAFDEVNNETVITDKYLILDNGIVPIIKITLENGLTIEVTDTHPLFAFKDKHFAFQEAKDLSTSDYLLNIDNKMLKIKSISKKKSDITYHISVLKFHTFISDGGIINHNTGKALDVRTPIPTPFGWKTMGDIQVGDKVFDDKGKVCNVTFVTEYQYDRNCFELRFDNGFKIIADEEHQWNVIIDNKEITVTTKHIIQNINNNVSVKIRMTRPVEYENTTKLCMTTIGRSIGIGREFFDSKYNYLTVKDRFELLKGLESVLSVSIGDCNTLIIKEGLLLKNIKELLSSLGIKYFIKDTYLYYKPRNRLEDLYEIQEYIEVSNIYKVESRPVKCISVDSENKLYLVTKNYIVTHNTYSMAIGMLHRLLTNKNFDVIMVAPMVTMIEEVVDQLVKFCETLPVYPIESKTKSPINTIKFNTGSVFKGISAGSSGATAVRGKKAKLIYMDECLKKGTKIKMSDGSWKPIEDIEIGDIVVSFNEDTKKFVTKRVVFTKCNGVKDVYEYKTVSGSKLVCTTNHPVYTRDGWIEIDKAKHLATLKTRTGNHFFESIVKKTYKGTSPVYNMQVEDTHTYVAEGFITHNCDYLSSKDLDSILAIINDNPDVEIWASSTPVGQGNLYRLAQNPSNKEFHFPTHVVDHYDDDLDAYNRSTLTSIAYEQEILANYGSSVSSVFQIQFIETSTVEDEQIDINIATIKQNRKDYIITVGVDWNKEKVGTRIVCLAYHRPTGLYHVVAKDRVGMKGWTQVIAVQRIVQMVEDYDVDHIYVDEGHGEMQDSQLRLTGQKAMLEEGPKSKTARLMDTVAVSFGSNLILTDPVTYQQKTKKTKQYMVEHLSNLLNRGLLVFKKTADEELLLQLKNYTVESISVNGAKKYKAASTKVGDHDLDAYMLAIHAIHQEYSELAGNLSHGSILAHRLPTPGTVQEREEDPSYIIGKTNNIVLNTKRSYLENKFRSSMKRNGFKARKRI